MEKPTRYKLEVNLTIVKEEWSGPILNDGEPDTRNENQGGYWSNAYSNDRLTVNETMQLGGLNFMQLMEVLVQLHNAVKGVQLSK